MVRQDRLIQKTIMRPDLDELQPEFGLGNVKMPFSSTMKHLILAKTKMVRRGMQTMVMELFTSIITAIITVAEVLCSVEEKQSIIFSGIISVKMI